MSKDYEHYEHLRKLAMEELDKLNGQSVRDAERVLDLEQKLDEAITRYEAAEEVAVVEAEDADENALAVRDNLRKRIAEQSETITSLIETIDNLRKKLEVSEELAVGVSEAGGHDNETKYLLQQKELETLRIDYANRDDELRVSENEVCELKQELEREKHASGQARVRSAHTNDEYLQEKAVADYATRLIRRLMNDVRGCDCKED